jgi:hypothetical protein
MIKNECFKNFMNYFIDSSEERTKKTETTKRKKKLKKI